MDIVQPSMICRSRSCDFGRGGSLDYLAYKLGSYQEAVDLAGTVVPGLQGGEFEEVEQLYHRRKLLEFFMDLEANSQKSDTERIFLRFQFRQTEVPHEAFSSSILFATGAEAQTLNFLLLECGVIPPPLLNNQPVILIPYWGNYHTLSRLVVLSKNLRQDKILKVEPFRHSWFGLLQKRSTCHAVDAFPTYLDAVASGEHFATNLPTRFPAHLLIDPLCDEPGYLPEDLVFHGHADTWFFNLPAWSLMENFSSCRFYEEGLGCMNLDSLLEHLLILSAHGDTRKFMDLCGSIRLPVVERSSLLLKAAQVLNREELAKLRVIMSRRLLYRDSKQTLYECAEGYEALVDNTLQSISNFTIQLNTVVSFPTLTEVNYQGTVTVGPVTFPFDLPSKYFEQPTKLEQVIRHTQESRPGHVVTEEVPRITKIKAFKYVLDWLRLEAATVERKKGYKNLGWTIRYDKFITPLKLVDTVGIQEGITYYPEELGDHHCYTSAWEALPEPATHDLQPELAELVSGMVSQVVRAYHGRPFHMLPVKNTAENKDLGLALFRGVGQTDVMRITNVRPANLALNRGMPCLVLPAADLQGQNLEMAGLYLSERGVDLQKFSKEISVAAEVLAYLITEIPRRLLAGEKVSFKDVRSVKPLSAVCVEGANLIREDFWPDWPAAGIRWFSVDKFLNVFENRLAEVVSYEENKAVIKPAAWESIGVDPEDFTMEHGLICKDVLMTEQGLRVDKLSFDQMLGDFYGSVPVIGKVPIFV